MFEKKEIENKPLRKWWQKLASGKMMIAVYKNCLLYTSDAADE